MTTTDQTIFTQTLHIAVCYHTDCTEAINHYYDKKYGGTIAMLLRGLTNQTQTDMEMNLKMQLLTLAINFHKASAEIYFQAFNKYADNEQLREQWQINCEYHKQQQFQNEKQLKELKTEILKLRSDETQPG